MQTQELEFDNRKKAFWVILVAVFACFLAYIYFVNLTIANIVERRILVSEISILSSEISEMEFEYLALGKEITPDLAFSLGFYESSNINFVTRDIHSNLAKLDL